MNKKIIEAVVDEIDAVLSAPITARGVDEALLIDAETRTEVRKLVERYLAEAPEPTSLVHQSRRR